MDPIQIEDVDKESESVDSDQMNLKVELSFPSLVMIPINRKGKITKEKGIDFRIQASKVKF